MPLCSVGMLAATFIQGSACLRYRESMAPGAAIQESLNDQLDEHQAGNNWVEPAAFRQRHVPASLLGEFLQGC